MADTEGKEYYKITKLLPRNGNEFNLDYINPNVEYGYNCIILKANGLEDKEEFKKNCIKVATYINDSEAKYPTLKGTERCKYLNFCINSVVRSTKSVKNSEYALIEAYKELFHQLNICENDIEHIQNSIFEKIDDLYKIHYKFNRFIDAIIASKAYNCQDITDCVILYTKYGTVCNENSKDDFCNALESFQNNYIQKINYITKCEHAEIDLPSYQKSQKITYDVELEEPVGDQEVSDIESKNTNTLIAISIILVIFSLLFILYKFTPFGSWLRPHIQRKKKNN
ncbi:Plasmodium vivax Vir protein, putative [Plasmodium vivax]|nr:Plasmodium vivax Vir protein, putative [Plasmodium vivax]